jgi:DNA-binding NtrC family response regulator
MKLPGPGKEDGRMIVKVAVAARDKSARQRLGALMAEGDVLVTSAPSLRYLIDSGKANGTDLIVAEVEHEGDVATAAAVQAAPVPPELVLLADAEHLADGAQRIGTGDVTVLARDLPDGELAAALWSALDERQVGCVDSGGGLDEPSPPVGGPMVELLALADRVAQSDSSVLITGETGAGKEWLARRIHEHSPRASGRFVAVNCAAIPEGLADSELFGHVRGAFTGAVRARRGHFEMAGGGTLFLDEVGELSPIVQGRLLRVLQDRSVQPLGGERPMSVDVRFIAATNRSLEEAVEQGSFRKDLYYRLAVINLSVPPLRERPEAIRALLVSYGRHFARELGRAEPRFSPRAVAALMSYSWPGNIRELINVVERAVLLGTDEPVDLEELPSALSTEGLAPGNGRPRGRHEPSARTAVLEPYEAARDEVLVGFERRYLIELLESVGGRVGEAARRAQMSPRTLYNKMRRHRLRKEDFKG